MIDTRSKRTIVMQQPLVIYHDGIRGTLHKSGDVIEVHQQLAESLIGGGLAREVKPDAEPLEVKIEAVVQRRGRRR